MADNNEVTMQKTLGLTGLTMNAMALIAPGAFLWLTFRDSGRHGPDRSVHVDRNLCRAAAVPGHGRMLRGDGQALSRNRQLVLLCRAIVLEPRRRLALGAARQVHRGMGLSSLLLDLSRRDGSGHGNPLRLPGGHAVAQFHERYQPRHGVHDADRDRILVPDRLYRPSGRERLHGGQYRHQCDSDRRAGAVRRAGSGLPHRATRRGAWAISSIPHRATPTTTSSPPPKPP